MNAANILVVDDEPQIRRVLRSTLSFRRYTISEASSGEEALELVRKLKPDLILLDVNLPGVSGVETCRELRRSSDVPIIMLTVRNSERDKVVALDAGADDYVTKPFGIEELLARVRASLRRRPSAESLAPFVSRDLSCRRAGAFRSSWQESTIRWCRSRASLISSSISDRMRISFSP